MATEKQEMQKELELQLHEQYAINNNANVSSFIAMIGALIIAFTGYGYVLYQYLMGECACCNLKNGNTNGTQTTLLTPILGYKKRWSLL